MKRFVWIAMVAIGVGVAGLLSLGATTQGNDLPSPAGARVVKEGGKSYLVHDGKMTLMQPEGCGHFWAYEMRRHYPYVDDILRPEDEGWVYDCGFDITIWGEWAQGEGHTVELTVSIVEMENGQEVGAPIETTTATFHNSGWLNTQHSLFIQDVGFEAPKEYRLKGVCREKCDSGGDWRDGWEWWVDFSCASGQSSGGDSGGEDP